MLRRRKKIYSTRLDDIEEEALKRLTEYWGVKPSECLRRTIIYTYIRLVENVEPEEDNLRRIYLKLLYSRFR
jgi:predicted DNA-binding protein